MNTFAQFEEFAVKTAFRAGEILIKHQGTESVVTQKDSQDIATTADIAAEKFIIGEIKKTFPSHNIFSEEIGRIENGSEYTWVIDPLDGTKEYAKGLFRYATLISCETKSELVASAVHFPKSKDIFSGSKGNEAHKGSQKCSLSTEGRLAESTVFTHVPDFKTPDPKFTKEWNISATIAKNCYRLRVDSWDAYSLSVVGSGAAEGYFLLFTTGPKWWDVASGLAIAYAAGATITNRYGNPFKLQNLEDGLVVSNGKIHTQLLDLINA